MTTLPGNRYCPAAKRLFYQSIPTMSRPLPILTVLIVAAALEARAAERPKIVLVPFVAAEGAPDGATQKFTGLLQAELKSRDGVELVSPPVARAAPVASSKKGPPPEAALALENGRRAFDELALEEAAAQLKKGIAASLADPATADFELLLDCHVKLAASYFRLGEEKDAKTALQDLARLAPSYVLPPGFPPVFQREFEKAKKRLDKQPRGQVSIEGPGGSTAFLDGRDLGMVPVLEEAVPAGTHYVKVDSGKGEVFGQVVEVKGGVAKVRAAFGGARGPAAQALADPAISQTFDEATQSRLAEWVKAAKADYGVVGVVFRTGDTQLTAGAALFSAKTRSTAALSAVTFDTDVLTANTEVFKLAEEIARRTHAFGYGATLPLNLVTKPVRTAVAKIEPGARPDREGDVEVVAPTRKTVVLTPKPEVRSLQEKSTLVDGEPPEDKEPPPPVVKSGGVPVWVWVVAGVAVAGGAAAGGYFAYSASRPVTGTVTATW